MYKNVYKEYIKNKEQINEKIKQLNEADKVIHTTYMDVDKSEEWKNDPKIRNRFKRQWASIRRMELRRNLINE